MTGAVEPRSGNAVAILPHPVQLLLFARYRNAGRGLCETILWPVIKGDNDAMHRLTVFVRDSKMRYINGALDQPSYIQTRRKTSMSLPAYQFIHAYSLSQQRRLCRRGNCL